MAYYPETKSGNPYHNPETGEFTSEGVEAVNEQLTTDAPLSNKQERINNRIAEIGIDAFITESSKNGGKNLRYYIDDNLSIPLVMNKSKQICANIMRKNLKVNNNDALDKIGIDLIGYDESTANIAEMKFIDVKTTYGDAVPINLFNAEYTDGASKAHFSRGQLLDERLKASNMFLFNFVNSSINMSDKDKVKLLCEQGTDKFIDKYISDNEMWAIPFEELQNIVTQCWVSTQVRNNLYDKIKNCFNENGVLIPDKKFKFKAFIDYLRGREQEKFDTKRNKYYFTISAKNGASITFSYNPHDLYYGLNVHFNLPRTLLWRYYDKNKIN